MGVGRLPVAIIVAVAVVAVAAVAFLFLGDGPQSPYVVLNEADGAILVSAYEEVGSLNASMDPVEARAELAERIKNYSGVRSADLGADNTTIFVECADGRVLIVDTWDNSEPLELNASEGGVTEASLGGWDGSWGGFAQSEVSAALAGAQEKLVFAPLALALGGVGQGTDLTTSQSRKVIMLVPVCYQHNVTAHLVCSDYFLDRGWDEADIVIKDNPYQLRPEDYFNLGDYGIILYFGHGYMKSVTNDSESWLQCCYISNSTFQQNKLYRQWLDEGMLAIRNYWTGAVEGGGSEEYYDVEIRTDLLKGWIDPLPSSFVHLATCHSYVFKDVFLSNGADVFLGWFRSVRANIADSNQVEMVLLMLNGSSALAAYRDEAVVQEYRDPSWKPKFNLVQFRIYPLPDAADAARSFHFPAWIESLTVSNIPQGASHIRVELYDGASNLLARKNFTVSSGSMVFDGLEAINLPAGGNPTVKVFALDSERDVIRTKTLEIERLEAGANEAEVSMGVDVWVLCSGLNQEFGINNWIHFSIYSTLEVYLNGELVKEIVSGGGYLSGVQMNATAGDTLRLVFRCDWTNPLHWHYSQFIDPLWLVHMENPQERHLQLTEYMDFGWSDDEPNPEGFDLTFTVPDFG